MSALRAYDSRPINDIKKLEGWAALICAIESKRLGQPIGTRLANVCGVLNLVYDHHPSFFPHLVYTLDRLKIDLHNQRTGKWWERTNKFYNGLYKDGPIPELNKKAGKLLEFIYP